MAKRALLVIHSSLIVSSKIGTTRIILLFAIPKLTAEAIASNISMLA